jgi:hypothetical protein
VLPSRFASSTPSCRSQRRTYLLEQVIPLLDEVLAQVERSRAETSKLAISARHLASTNAEGQSSLGFPGLARAAVPMTQVLASDAPAHAGELASALVVPTMPAKVIPAGRYSAHLSELQAGSRKHGLETRRGALHDRSWFVQYDPQAGKDSHRDCAEVVDLDLGRFMVSVVA